MFYPESPADLGQMVDGFLKAATPKTVCATSSRLVGIISPHAGYIYSGPTAGFAFKAIMGQKFDRVYFLGVDHRTGLGSVSVFMAGPYKTPLGEVPLDVPAAESLLQHNPGLATAPEQHLQEHSIEVQLPFYQKALGNHPAVFISVGGPTENGLELGEQLLRELQGFSGRVLIVASSDWSHYHSQEEARILDSRGIQSVLALDPDGLQKLCFSQETELCGINGVLALTTLMKEASATVTLLDQSDSGKAAADTTRVVGYAALLFEASAIPSFSSPAASPTSEPIISSDSSSAPVSPDSPDSPINASAAHSDKENPVMDFHQQALHAVRHTLEEVLAGRSVPKVTLEHEKFAQNCGVFVTLKKHGDLRGCIGLIEGIRPLGKAIQEMAIAAATEDPRFPPVTLQELKEIHIEISVLTPLIPVSNLDEIKVGRDGVVLKKYPNSGVFLPQVATEQGWDRDTFLENLCYKAGLPSESHKAKDAKLFRFEAEVFGEKE